MRGLGVALKGKRIFLLGEISHKENAELAAASSVDGFLFDPFSQKPSLTGMTGRKEDLSKCKDFRITESRGTYFLTYKTKARTKTALTIATSRDCIRWRAQARVATIAETGMLVPEHTHEGKYVMYFGEKSIRVAYSKDMKIWKTHAKPILAPRKGSFDAGSLSVAGIVHAKEGIVIIYYAKAKRGKYMEYAVGSALLAKHDPTKVLWRSEVPLWSQSDSWRGKQIYPIGVVEFGHAALIYWGHSGGMFGVAAPFLGRVGGTGIPAKPRLGKFASNPIIAPDGAAWWESQATFNPAAIYEGGRVHLLYRAIGKTDVSVLGYASSIDGVRIDERLAHPAYVPREVFEGARTRRKSAVPQWSPYMSGGGGSGGCEDPRLMRIGEKIYMTYVAYDGWSGPRIALTSISIDSFLNRKWNWTRPVLISPPGVIDKNACILPEKIGGKYVIFHRVFPNIQIDFVDSLDFDGKTKFLKPQGDAVIRPRPAPFWDSRKIGIGAPPIKTKEGWLLIYQGMGGPDGTSSPYKIGAMLLDLKDPTKVLCRARQPVLEPYEWYENDGYKSGVIYPCGAAVIGDTLFVYYGGADRVTCVATAPLREFVADLLLHEEAHLEPVVMKEGSVAYGYR